jgi:hypothetical protein
MRFSVRSRNGNRTRSDVRRLLCGAAAALLFLCAATATRAGDLAANPTLLPKTLMALRGEQRDRTQLQLVFDRSRDGQATAPLTVWLGADYFATIDGAKLNITDLRLQRRFVVNRQDGSLVNLSLYGDVMFRRIEVLRREQIAAALAKEPSHPATPAGLRRFWIESELGVMATGKPLAAELTQDAATTWFRWQGVEVAAIVPGDTAVPGSLVHSYRTFLHRTLPLHPSITDWLGQLGTVPSHLDFTSEATGKAQHVALRLRSARTVDADFPMPPHLTLQLLPWGPKDPDVALMRKVLPIIDAAVTEPAKQTRSNAIAADRALVASDFAHGRKFAAALGLAELALRWGRDATACDGRGCRSKEEINRLLRDDPRSIVMFQATALQQHEPGKALALWRALDRSDLPNAYMIDVFLAPLLSENGDRAAAAKSFAAAFAGDPRIPLLYRELGDHFTRVSRLDLAWLCYDLGRALPGRTTPDALSAIDSVEQKLAETYPYLF